MNRVNYDKKMQEIIDGLKGKPRLYLHSCCAPCSTACLERLFPYFNLTVVYYNPNIDTAEEYALRAAEEKRYIKEVYGDKIKIIENGHNPQVFEEAAKGMENCKEGGERCRVCYKLRMEYAAALCNKEDFFATTLTVSPLKNAEVINVIGEELAEKYGVNYLPTDFKKREGYKRSIVLSEEHLLYRQNYCGCRFSKNRLNENKEGI